MVIFLIGASVPAAFAAEHNGNSSCSGSGAPTGFPDTGEDPGNVGQFASFIAQEVGHSADNNPGNAMNPAPPFVPFVLGCNPNA
jgi:hypothetical protein